jgi:hypothetical protein
MNSTPVTARQQKRFVKVNSDVSGGCFRKKLSKRPLSESSIGLKADYVMRKEQQRIV